MRQVCVLQPYVRTLMGSLLSIATITATFGQSDNGPVKKDPEIVSAGATAAGTDWEVMLSANVLAQDLDSINPILRSSLDSYFRTTEAIEVSNQLQIAKNELDRKVISNPKALMAGHVFMREGIASQGLVQMANRLKVDIAEVYARIPVGQRGVVWTFWRETPASNSLSQAERLALVEKSIRAAIFKLAAEAVHSEDKEEGIALRTAPITYSAFVALGPARSVSNLRRELSVFDVAPIETSRSDALVRFRESEKGRGPRNTYPVLPAKSDQQNFGVPQGNGTAKQDIAQGSGGTVTPQIAQPSCSTLPLCWPLWRYWTPDTQTPGSGAVIRSHFVVTIRATENLLDGFTDTSLKWGQNGLSLQSVNVGYIATASWNPRSVVLPYYPPCSFDYDVGGVSAPCDQTTQYKPVYVPAGTYEDEVHIPNPQCSVSSRTGTPDDRPYGCYVASGYETSFPRPYLDTNVLDGPAYYIATMGSAEGQSLNATVTYRNKIYFWAYGNTSGAGYTFYHKGQMGTRIPTGCYSKICVYSTNTATYRSAIVVNTGSP
jgi:hypothetical protein